MGPISLTAFAKPLATGALVLACLCETPPEDIEGSLRQAAQHFADLEDDKAKAILDELDYWNVVEAKVLLGHLYSDPLYAARDYESAVVAFEEAAASGSEEALFQIAESRFWPDYSNWTLAAREEAIRPTRGEAFHMLQAAVQDQPGSWGEAGARYWRLAWLCTFGGYDCGKEVTDAAVRKGGQQLGNLRMIVNAFQMIDVGRSSEGDASKDTKLMQAFLALGMAAADPFVGSLASHAAWRDLDRGGSCPEPVSLQASGRLLALESDVVADPGGWEDFRLCFDAGQEAVVREDLAKSLDELVRDYSNQDTWHLRTCYQDPQAATFGDCLIHAVRDHYFVCTKLSLIDYFRTRYKMHYADSARYARCRDAMIAARQG